MIKFNRDHESISKCMGLPDGREQEIKRELIKLVAANEDFVAVMEQMVAKITDEAELLYAFFAIGELAGTLNPEAPRMKEAITGAVSLTRLLYGLDKNKADKNHKNDTKNPLKWE